jgi:hypothetical protein
MKQAARGLRGQMGYHHRHEGQGAKPHTHRHSHILTLKHSHTVTLIELLPRSLYHTQPHTQPHTKPHTQPHTVTRTCTRTRTLHINTPADTQNAEEFLVFGSSASGGFCRFRRSCTATWSSAGSHTEGRGTDARIVARARAHQPRNPATSSPPWRRPHWSSSCGI